MKKALLILIVSLLITIGGFTFAQEKDWIEYSGSDIIVYSPDRSYGIVIQDRNVGATMTGYGNTTDTGSFGYHYQWGNNYGFQTCYTSWCTTFPGGETTSTIKVNTTDYGPDNPYLSNIFIKTISQGDWSSVRNDNLRGGLGDDETNGWGLTSNNPITGRQGPCPEGYHVPSIGERNELRIIWYNNEYNTGLNIGDFSHLVSADTPITEAFQKDLLIPYSWMRFGDDLSVFRGQTSLLWSSTPDDIYADYLELLHDSRYHIYVDYEYRGNAGAVRCFKNERIVDDPNAIVVTFDANGGEFITTDSVTVALGDILDISGYSGMKDGWEFVGWNTNPSEGAVMSNPVVRGPMTLYAIYEKEVTVTYTSGDGVDSIGKNSDSCFMNKVEIGCSVIAPSITISKTGYSGIWSNGNVVVKPGDYITLTGDDTYTTDITPNTYTVKFNANGGKGSMKNQSFTYDIPQKLTGNTFTKSGYIFSGWTYGGVGYKDKQLVNNLTSVNGKTITFTAQWKVDPGYIVYGPFYTNDGNEFMIALSTTDGTINTGVTITENSGYTESQLWEMIGGDTENMSGEVVDIEDLGGDVLFLKYLTGTKYITKGFCSTEGGCNYFETNGSQGVTDEFKNQAMNIGNVQGPAWAILANDYVEYNQVGTSGFVVLVRDSDVDGYVYVPINKYTITFVDEDGTTILQAATIYNYGTLVADIVKPADPTKDGYNFAGWNPALSDIMADVTYTATYTENSGIQLDSLSGSSSNSSYSSLSYRSSSRKKKPTDNNDVINSVDLQAVQTNGYTKEMNDAYEFAYRNRITTMDSIEKADMRGGLTRIAMAKMLSYYAINVLGMKPDKTRVNKFYDVSDDLSSLYDNGANLAYQLGIMGINMGNNFRPLDLVTRAEFVTALSRLLYGIEDGKDLYYSPHMELLNKKGIITVIDPFMEELRGYVMIILMRSATTSDALNEE